MGGKPKQQETVKRVAGITIRTAQKILTWTGYGGAVTIHYKRLSSAQKHAIMSSLADPRTGEVADRALLFARVVSNSIIDWSGVWDEQGEPAPINELTAAQIGDSAFSTILGATFGAEDNADADPLPA